MARGPILSRHPRNRAELDIDIRLEALAREYDLDAVERGIRRIRARRTPRETTMSVVDARIDAMLAEHCEAHERGEKVSIAELARRALPKLTEEQRHKAVSDYNRVLATLPPFAEFYELCKPRDPQSMLAAE